MKKNQKQFQKLITVAMKFLPEWNLAGVKRHCNLTGKDTMINRKKKLNSKKMPETVENH